MMSDADWNELITLLEERLRVIGDAELRGRDPEAQLERLQEVSEAIMTFHETHRSGMQPRLNHFLESCSYAKALDWASEARAGR